MAKSTHDRSAAARKGWAHSTKRSRRKPVLALDKSYTVESRGYDTPCWIWIGKGSNGYGMVTIKGRQMKAHVAAYEKQLGPIPDGYVVHHLCSQKNCVNPAHLKAMTNAEHSLLHGALSGYRQGNPGRCPEGCTCWRHGAGKKCPKDCKCARHNEQPSGSRYNRNRDEKGRLTT